MAGHRKMIFLRLCKQGSEVFQRNNPFGSGKIDADHTFAKIPVTYFDGLHVRIPVGLFRPYAHHAGKNADGDIRIFFQSLRSAGQNRFYSLCL